MGFLLFILLLFIVIPYVGIKLLGYLFGGSGRKGFYESDSSSTSQRTSEKKKKRKKIIGENEGEYVDFEEIKQ